QFPQRVGHLQLLGEVHAGARALLAVSQGGVEDDQTVVGHGTLHGTAGPHRQGRGPVGETKRPWDLRSQGRFQYLAKSSRPRQPGPIPPLGGAKGPEAGLPWCTASLTRLGNVYSDGSRHPSTIALL